jgi:D-beta-D-heptose 7-phosphate kinase/D-beta-D-heptose 1-phosphate adenosyltransferase
MGKIIVVGDFMLDRYIWGKSDRLSPEAPVPVVLLNKEEEKLGGAGNVVRNLLSLGSKVLPVGVVGWEGERIINLLKEEGCSTAGIFLDKGRPLTIKTRVIVENQQLVRLDKEKRTNISAEQEKKIFSFIKKNAFEDDLIILSDYDKGTLTSELCRKIIDFSRKKGIKVLVDPKKNVEKFKGAYLIKPNRKEMSSYLGIEINKLSEKFKKRVFSWIKEMDISYLLLTLSEEGMLLFSRSKAEKFESLRREVFDVTGAGDTVISVVAHFLLKGVDLSRSIYFSNLGAGIVVGKLGSATTTEAEIMATEKLNSNYVDHKIFSYSQAEMLRKKLSGKKVVFTNGCFDILHLGHVKYLQKAKSLGDVLVVGLNSDSSVKKIKGKDRPFNYEYERAYLLASLEVVDYVVIFSQPTPYRLIQKLKPDILVKGADYNGKKVVGSNLVKEVRLIEFIEGKSTTGLIEKIRDV